MVEYKNLNDFSNLGKLFFIYGIISVFSLVTPILSYFLPLFEGFFPEGTTLYLQTINFSSYFGLMINYVLLFFMAIIITKIRKIDKIISETGSYSFFPKFLIAFLLSLLNAFISLIVPYIIQALPLEGLGLIERMKNLSLYFSLTSLIRAIILTISTIFYIRVWKIFDEIIFNSKIYIPWGNAKRCRNAVKTLKIGLILSYVIFILPIFINLIDGFYFGEIVAGILNFVLRIFNAGFYLVSDIFLLIAYFRLGNNLRSPITDQIVQFTDRTTAQTTDSISNMATEISVTPLYCPQCGSKLDPGSSFCSVCGNKKDF